MATGRGGGFGTLWIAAVSSNLADGVARTVVPLIAASLTRDPVLIALLTAMSFLPWLLFGLAAGVAVDRFDRRVVMSAANAVRCVTAVVLAVLAGTGAITMWWLLVAAVLFGLGETLFDNATNAVLPTLVPAKELDRANGRIQAAQVSVESFIAQPVAGLLFAVSLALPLWLGAAGYIVPTVLALLLPVAAARASAVLPVESAAPLPSVDTDDVAVGGAGTVIHGSAGPRVAATYLWRHRFLRAMVGFGAVVGSAFVFAQAAAVLYLLDTQRVPPALMGFVLAAVGGGALLGSLAAAGLVGRFGRSRVMYAANVGAALALGAMALAPEAWSATAAYAALAFSISLWNVPWGALRQQIVPQHLFGRVLGITRTLTWGIFPIAIMLGGLVARVDLRLPFAIAAAVCLVATLLCTRLIRAADEQVP